MKLTKYDYHVLMIKDMCQMTEFTLQLIFIKMVSQIVIKKIVIKKTVIKKVVIIEKHYD